MSLRALVTLAIVGRGGAGRARAACLPLQLAPGNEIYGRLCAHGCDSGVVYGARGDGEGWNDDILGDDDGTVGLDEAQLPAARDRISLRLGHTRISYHDSSVRQVRPFPSFANGASTIRRATVSLSPPFPPFRSPEPRRS